MHVLDANELFGVTSYTFDRIMEVGGRIGPDAFALYFKLMKQARIQQTNQTYSLNEFLKKGMGRGDERLKNAKKILKQLGLVDDINVKDEKGKISGHYIRVNYLINEEKVRTAGTTYNLSTKGVCPGVDDDHNWGESTTGGTDANALSTKIGNAGNTKIQTQEEKTKEFGDRLKQEGFSDELIQVILDFDKKKKKGKMSQMEERYLKKWIKELRTHGENKDELMIEVIEQSIINGRDGLFSVKKQAHYKPRVESINRH